jgi:hypothetical protein
MVHCVVHLLMPANVPEITTQRSQPQLVISSPLLPQCSQPDILKMPHTYRE